MSDTDEAAPEAGSPEVAGTPAHTVGRLPLIERGEELTALSQVLRDGQAATGQLAVVDGPAGIGKTRLLGEIRNMLRTSNVDVLEACGGELEQGNPLGLVLRLIEQRIAGSSSEDLDQIFRGQAGKLQDLLTGARGKSLAALTDEFVLLHSIYWLIVNLTENRPVVFVVDDMQWADAPSLRFLLYLAQRLQDLPVVLVTALRIGDPAAEDEVISRLILQADLSLTLQGLTVEGVRELLSAEFPPSTNVDRIARDTWSATRGNPFLVREVASAVRNGERFGDDPSHIASAPESVARSTMLRISAVGEHAVAVARAVAVLGGSATLTAAAHVAGLTHADALRAAERLAAVEIFTPGAEPAFYHPIIRSAVYLRFAADARARAHLTAARLLHDTGAAPEEVALHLMRSTVAAEPWVRACLLTAARRAGGKGSPATAVQFLRQALEWSKPEDGEDPALLIELGTMEAAAGETGSLRHLERAHLTAGGEDRARAMYALGQTLFRYGRPAEALTVFRRGADEFTEHDRDLQLRFEAGYLASAAYLIGTPQKEAIARGTHLAGELGEPDEPGPAERLLVLHLALFRTMSEPGPQHADQVLRALGDCIQLWRDTSDGMALSHTVLTLTWCAVPSEAVAVADQVLAEARRRGDALVFAEVSLTRALAMYARGRVNDAMADAQMAMTGMRRGWKTTVPAPHGVLAFCHLDRGEFDEAHRVLELGEQNLRDNQTPGLNVWFYMARGRLTLANNDPQAAFDDFVLVGRLLSANGFDNPGFVLMPWRSQAALAAHKLGRTDEAHELIDQDIELGQRFDLPNVLGAALRCKGLTASPVPSTDLLLQSVNALDQPEGSVLELATSLMYLGIAQRRLGQRAECRDVLRRALDFGHQAGALSIESRVHEELHAAGARPRRPVIQGPDALTPSERRIASLMAEGLTSRQIAESLYLTINTIEWHRRNIYRKLSVTSREALGDALAGDGDE